MHSQFKGQVFRKDGRSYLVLDRDVDSPEWVWVRAISPARERVRMRRDEIAGSLSRAGPAAAERR
jgi:hypothetical protein